MSHMTSDSLASHRISFPHQQEHRGEVFPHVLECQSGGVALKACCAWIAAKRDELLERTSASGAILFRGFPVATAEAFDRFIAAFGLENFPYERSLSNAVRVNRTPRVFTANEAPASATILLHHEMAQTPVYPSRLFFFCQQPAATGGATPICRSDVLWERLAERCPQFARDCQEKGLIYRSVMPPENDVTSGMGRSWQSTFGTTTRADAERRLRNLGYSWQWRDDGSLCAITPVLPAIRTLADGRVTFFNQLIAAAGGWKDDRNDPAQAVTFGDGSPIDRQAVSIAAQLADSLIFDIPWQAGDVALLDNYLTMHGRRTFTGARKVLASLIAME